MYSWHKRPAVCVPVIKGKYCFRHKLERRFPPSSSFRQFACFGQNILKTSYFSRASRDEFDVMQRYETILSVCFCVCTKKSSRKITELYWGRVTFLVHVQLKPQTTGWTRAIAFISKTKRRKKYIFIYIKTWKNDNFFLNVFNEVGKWPWLYGFFGIGTRKTVVNWRHIHQR